MRARLRDPITSKTAAIESAAFARTHSERILVALEDGTKTAKEISRITGLTVVQIDRRLPELQRAGKVRIVQIDGSDLVREGFRVWGLV